MPEYDNDRDQIAAAMLTNLTGDSGKVIEAMEKHGQSQIVNSRDIPKDMRGVTREQAENMGIIFGDEVNDLFVVAVLPMRLLRRRLSRVSLYTPGLVSLGRRHLSGCK